MEAARTLASLGDGESVDGLIDLFEWELANVYSPGSKWGSHFLGSSARVVVVESLIFLRAAKFLSVIDRLRRQEGVPHVQDALNRAREILSVLK